METLNGYYTYAYLRVNKTPYYIGKGSKNRLYKRTKKDIKPPKDKSRIILLKQNLTEENAFKHEKYMIGVFGRKDLGTGILHNRTDGGEGGSGVLVSEETRKKLSESKKGENNPNYRKIPSEETRKRKSKAMMGKIPSQETRRKRSIAMKGKSHSEETRRKISEALKGKSPSEETRRKRSVAMKGKSLPEETKRKQSEVKRGKNNPNYGKKGKDNPHYGKIHSEETKRKQSEVKKGKYAGENNPNYGKRGEDNCVYGTKWWNDGKGNCKRSIECPGEGWVSGRGKR
jgi:hypothetical protein